MVSDPGDAGLTVALEAEELRQAGLEACFGARPIVLELGFGRAELIMQLAAADPARGYLGVEVSRKRVEKAARKVARRGLPNLRLVHAPAEYLLERVLPPACTAECWINFPDPWPKKRHFKRRLFQPPFMVLLARVLEPGAPLHAATDHMGYAEWIAELLGGSPDFENPNAPTRWTDRSPPRRETSYEAEWRAQGRAIAYFEYRRRATLQGP